MDTIELTLTIPPVEHAPFLAELEEPATGFVQTDTELRAYVPADRWAAVDQKQLEARLAADGHPDALSIRPLESKNWNAVWEDTLSPVRAGPFLVCPTSVAPPSGRDDATVLRIDPEMSFGTGHHATTRLALRLLAEALVPGDRVLDVGTGTGVLAIAACRLGADAARGVDTNPDAVRNARENVRRNEETDRVTVQEGSVDVAPGTRYDLVAANITRRVLLKLMPGLVSCLAPDASLLLSGLLRPHRDDIRDATASHGLALNAEAAEEGWWAGRFARSPSP
ncbi:50S ribosomal protein L11 methyltransferase [Salinibacter sp.]|jgi:ribosomal protein L11 methyltransferase|uniref:50S ribosomal protein L11 methyltransferase n=1 Tax=Salinibacter sp. TaxID=2065818 RepID=UPI0021E98C2D|nr:50S ribosomal protein L11 methyltransferase [Salinibacter sp.]